jgi:hypothetical protein
MDSQNRTARTGQPERFSRNWTALIEQPGQGKQTEQDCQHSTVRTVLLGQDIFSEAARTGKPEQDSLNGTYKMGQEDNGMQIRCQYTIASIGLLGQDSSAGLPRKDCRHRTPRQDAETGLP